VGKTGWCPRRTPAYQASSMLASAPGLKLYSYVVRYDSGFAPNPFYGHCTLATCKPDIRRSAQKAHWVVGTGSAERRVRRGGYLVYAMLVSEILTFDEYWIDPRFQGKKPSLHGSKMIACGDNLYSRNKKGGWDQLDSFHTNENGSPPPRHIKRDTATNRLLVSDSFVYFGGEGPKIPARFRNYAGEDICKFGIGQKTFDNPKFISDFAGWIGSLGATGYSGRPLDWVRAS
jgi:hypothetical protein